jgi:hypothetical protein
MKSEFEFLGLDAHGVLSFPYLFIVLVKYMSSLSELLDHHAIKILVILITVTLFNDFKI